MKTLPSVLAFAALAVANGVAPAGATSAPPATPANLEQAPANLEQAPANLEQAPANLEQAPANLEQAPANLEQAPANLEQAPANLEQAQGERGEHGAAQLRVGRSNGGAEPPAPLRPRERGAMPTSTSVVGLIALFAAAALAWWKRRRRPASEVGETIELLAQSSLGGRARAMWLRAGERDMVVAVTAQAVQVLATWQTAGGDTEGRAAASPRAAAPAALVSSHSAALVSSPSAPAAPAALVSSHSAALVSSPSAPAQATLAATPSSPAALHPRPSAMRAARPGGARCRPSHRRRGEGGPP